MTSRRFEITEDGSTTLFVPELNEHYHSIHGAIQESKHVFIEAGLKQIYQKELVIFEVGFGTGLNTLLSLLHATKTKQKIKFITIEKYPLTTEEISIINYPKLLNAPDEIFKQIHSANWDQWVNISNNFQLLKINNDIKEIDFKGLPLFNLVYFDAFAPNKQPQIWNQVIYQKIFQHSNANAIFVSYCAKGVVRRDLQAVGYNMERIPGPPGKKEMLRGIK